MSTLSGESQCDTRSAHTVWTFSRVKASVLLFFRTCRFVSCSVTASSRCIPGRHGCSRSRCAGAQDPDAWMMRVDAMLTRCGGPGRRYSIVQMRCSNCMRREGACRVRVPSKTEPRSPPLTVQSHRRPTGNAEDQTSPPTRVRAV